MDASAAHLELQLQKALDGRCEERFAWIFGNSIVLCGLLVYVSSNFFGCIAIILMAIVFNIFAAKWLGVEWVIVPLEQLYERALRLLPDEKKE